MQAIISYFDNWDKAASSKIHSMKTQTMMQYCLLIPVYAF